MRHEDLQGSYICGRCGAEMFYLLSAGKASAIPCDDCGFYGGDKPYDTLPSEIKIDLTQY